MKRTALALIATLAFLGLVGPPLQGAHAANKDSVGGAAQAWVNYDPGLPKVSAHGSRAIETLKLTGAFRAGGVKYVGKMQLGSSFVTLQYSAVADAPTRVNLPFTFTGITPVTQVTGRCTLDVSRKVLVLALTGRCNKGSGLPFTQLAIQMALYPNQPDGDGYRAVGVYTSTPV